MQFEVQSEASLGGRVAEGLKCADQCLGRGEVGRCRLIPEPVAARGGSRLRQAYAAAHAFDRVDHLACLSPCSIKQEEMRARRFIR